jgi:sec-independent protein translocase protein TatB
MEFLGIGPLELFFIVLIALILLGPQDMVKAGRTIGRILRRTVLSPSWMNIQRKVRNLPYELMREAGIEENEVRGSINDLRNMSRIDLGQELTRSGQQQKYGVSSPGNSFNPSPTPPTEFVEPPQIPTPSESLQPVSDSPNGNHPESEENAGSVTPGEAASEEPGTDSQQR